MKINKNGFVILMIIIDLCIIILQSVIVILMFVIYGGSELTKTQDRIVIISDLCIVINELFLLMKFHSNWKDSYKAKLKRGISLRIFVVMLNFVGIVIQLDIGNSMKESEALDKFGRHENTVIGVGFVLEVLLIISMSMEMCLKGKSRKGRGVTLNSEISELKGNLYDQTDYNE